MGVGEDVRDGGKAQPVGAARGEDAREVEAFELPRGVGVRPSAREERGQDVGGVDGEVVGPASQDVDPDVLIGGGAEVEPVADRGLARPVEVVPGEAERDEGRLTGTVKSWRSA